jgi:hypothetical protein
MLLAGAALPGSGGERKIGGWAGGIARDQAACLFESLPYIGV